MASGPQENRRRRRSPVALDIIQKNISVSMGQVIVNMTDPALQAFCMQQLRIDDVLQADGKILEILKDIDEKQEEKRTGASKNHRRRMRDEN